MSTRKPNRVNQHEPLRVPQGWSDQSRALVMQIERLFNDIYEKLGSIRQNLKSIWDSVVDRTNEVYITNQYTTVLAAINAYKDKKAYPFTIQKAGNSAYTDLPSELPNTCEWTLVCSGDAQRTTAVLTVYTGGSSRNGWSYTANLFEGAYILSWSAQTVVWKYAERKGVTQSSGGSDYWTLTSATFPAIAGYSRRVVGISTTNQYVSPVMYTIGSNDTVTVYVYNHSNTSQTYDISAVFLYLPDNRRLT